MKTSFESLRFDEQLPLLQELAEEATALWDLPDKLSVSLMNLSENATYKLEATDGRRWALRIHRGGYHSDTAVASELAWLMSLRNEGVAITPRPLPGRNGELIQKAKHSTMARVRNVVLSAWETGVEPGIAENLIEPFKSLGEVTARMHQHARRWKRPDWFQRLTWDFETALGDHAPHWGRWRDGLGMNAAKEKLFQRTVDVIGKRLSVYGANAERFGLIHCDLRLANLLVDGKTVKVIDFDDCGFGWFMYDAATPVSFHEHEPQVPELIEAWKEGYRRASHLAKADEAEIPTFIMYRRLLLVAWIGTRRDTDLAKSMGIPYTEGTADLCEKFLLATA